MQLCRKKINNLITVSNTHALCSKYNVFEDRLGTFRMSKIALKIQDNMQPRHLKPRPVPFALKPKIDNEISGLVKTGVLISVEFSDWATPIVPLLKPNGTVRLCGDFKVTINLYLIDQQYPLPRIEYLFSQLEGSKKFAYQQVLLTDEGFLRIHVFLMM